MLVSIAQAVLQIREYGLFLILSADIPDEQIQSTIHAAEPIAGTLCVTMHRVAWQNIATHRRQQAEDIDA